MCIWPRRGEGLVAVIQQRAAGLPALEANVARRRAESAAVRDALSSVAGPLLLAGDFNMPTESAIYRTGWSSYANAFLVGGWGWGAASGTEQ